MKIAALFSGGKDSAFAAYKALQKGHELVCLVSMRSKNPESYMFHVPNIDLVGLQAKAMELPLILEETHGRKEEELEDLKDALERAKAEFSAEGVVCGALASQYQFDRVKKICDELGLEVLTPLWQIDAKEYMQQILDEGFDVIISAIAAQGFTKDFLGKKIDSEIIKKLEDLYDKYQINIHAEGGEYETFVLDCPMFRQRIEILEAEARVETENCGIYEIKKARLADKS